jgi:hypothetical protein
VNFAHLWAFCWLRWRLLANQFRKAGIGNAVLVILVIPLVGFSALGAFGALLFAGWFALAEAPALAVLGTWDGLVVAFLFTWGISLLTELQRSEALSLQKLLHLPVSLRSAFLINYLSSLFSLNLAVFVPAAAGLALGLALGKGPAQLVTFPLVAAFFLMITAVTYQFQGWLAALMVNKRRRRTIIALFTAGFVLLAQLPNLFNLLHLHKHDASVPLANERNKELNEASEALRKHEITTEQFRQRQAEAERRYAEKLKETNDREISDLTEWGWIINLALPPGWLPLGAMAAAEGNLLPALLGTAGLTLLGAGSLWRSYRTTVRLYTGQYTAGPRRQPESPQPQATPATAGPATAGLLEKGLPGLSEQAQAVALGNLVSLLRAPEAKMMLLTPVAMILVFVLIGVANATDPLPDAVRPLVAFGGVGMVLLGMVGVVGNQFGFDRNGFRVYVLSGASRRDILLGKNLAVAPIGLGLGLTVVAVVEILLPMRFDRFLAAVAIMTAMFLVFCALANLIAILVPMRIAPGSMKPTNPKVASALLQMCLVFTMPWVMLPLLLPFGVELLLEALAVIEGWPIALPLALVECTVVALLYRVVLGWQGALLHAREQSILETVTTRAE